MAQSDYTGYGNYDYRTEEQPRQLAANSIYMHVAEEMLGKLYPNMERTRYTEMMYRRDFEEIENRVGVMPLLEAAISGLRSGLENYHVYLPGEFLDIVLYSDAPNADIGDKLSKQVHKQINNRDAMARVTLDALFAVHNAWRKKEAEINANNRNPKKRFMLLPPELVGFDILMENYFYIYEIIQILDLWVEPRFLRNLFEERQQRFIGFTHGDTLHRSGLDGLITEIDETHPGVELAHAIALQVREHAPIGNVLVYL